MPRRAKTDTLPADVRAWLEQTLADRSHPGYAALSEMLAERGHAISASSLHRTDQRIQRALGAIRASTEAARLIAEAAPDSADERSAAVISLVQSGLFEAMLAFAESQDESVRPGDRLKLLGQAARSIADVSRASIGNKEHAEKVREKTAAAAAAVDRIASKAGLSAESVAAIRAEIMGISG